MATYGDACPTEYYYLYFGCFMLSNASSIGSFFSSGTGKHSSILLVLFDNEESNNTKVTPNVHLYFSGIIKLCPLVIISLPPVLGISINYNTQHK